MEAKDWTELLLKAHTFAKTIGLEVLDSDSLDPYYKGDLNGTQIWTCSRLDDEEELFNVLHLMGHCVEWGTSHELMVLGEKLYPHPNDELLRRLQEYEWQANCYGLTILHDIGGEHLDEWMFHNYQMDMFYLTHFYKTGEKVKYITEIALKYAFTKPLVPMPIPAFKPQLLKGTRNGIVINFETPKMVNPPKPKRLPRVPG